MSKRKTNREKYSDEKAARRAKFIIQILCLMVLVLVVVLDAANPDYEASIPVYAIIGGIALGVGGKDFIQYISGNRK